MTFARACRSKHPDPYRNASSCGLCRLVATVPGYAKRFGEERPEGVETREEWTPDPPLVQKFPAILDRCPHLRPKPNGVGCGSDLYRCGLDGALCSTMGGCKKTERFCAQCPDFPANAPPLTPLKDVQVAGLIETRHATNCSILPHNGKLLFAYRTGWQGSHIQLCELDSDYRAGPSRTVRLKGLHPHCEGGREDPRLFVHAGRLHLAFVGVYRDRAGTVLPRQLFARLTDDGQPEQVWEPDYAGTPVEKNWQPFSHEGRLYAVYSMRPWRVLELLPDGGTAVAGEAKGVPWTHGFARGGAPPVRHGDEYYAFFHGTDKSHPRDAVYTLGVCTFEARPPFRPLRLTRAPILRPALDRLPTVGGDDPDWKDRPWHAATVFPCGAFRDGDRWVVSYGDNDHFCRVAEFDAGQIEERLRPV